MSVVAKQVNVCTEVDTLLGVLTTAVKDVKAGKGPGEVVSDLVPGLVTALTGVGQLASEVKDRPDLERTVALKVCDLVDALVG